MLVLESFYVSFVKVIDLRQCDAFFYAGFIYEPDGILPAIQ